jgi:hypothetical protein
MTTQTHQGRAGSHQRRRAGVDRNRPGAQEIRQDSPRPATFFCLGFLLEPSKQQPTAARGLDALNIRPALQIAAQISWAYMPRIFGYFSSGPGGYSARYWPPRHTYFVRDFLQITSEISSQSSWPGVQAGKQSSWPGVQAGKQSSWPGVQAGKQRPARYPLLPFLRPSPAPQYNLLISIDLWPAQKWPVFGDLVRFLGCGVSGLTWLVVRCSTGDA